MKSLSLVFILISSSTFAQLGISYEVLSTISNIHQPSPIKIKKTSKDIEALIEYSLDETLSRLSFSLKSTGNSSVPAIASSGRAHCVGYSKYFASVLNAALVKNKVEGYRVSHVRAKIRVLNFNPHQLFNDPSFKDHDLCLITNVKTGEKIFVDPSLSEVLGKVIVKQ